MNSLFALTLVPKETPSHTPTARKTPPPHNHAREPSTTPRQSPNESMGFVLIDSPIDSFSRLECALGQNTVSSNAEPKELIYFWSSFERMAMNSNIIVVGCGRVGSQLANMLSENNNNVCVIDKNTDAFSGLGRSFNGSVVQGVGYDEETLHRAGIETADCVCAVTQLDHANLMVAEVAKRLYHVPHVIARLYNPSHERAYEQLGLDYVCGTSLVAEEMFAKVSSGHGAHVESFGDFELLRFSLNLRNNKRRTIRVGELERSHDIRIIAFQRADGRASSIPNADSTLCHGDSVLACVRYTMVPQFSKWIQD